MPGWGRSQAVINAPGGGIAFWRTGGGAHQENFASMQATICQAMVNEAAVNCVSEKADAPPSAPLRRHENAIEALCVNADGVGSGRGGAGRNDWVAQFDPVGRTQVGAVLHSILIPGR